MPRFQFSLRSSSAVREAGVVQSDTFAEALTAIDEHVTATEGDMLEIGVPGFPPARYECVSGLGENMWRPTGLLAA